MLVKLPREVGKIMTKLQSEGFEAYVVGDCVRDSILGKKPFGWDISTDAGLDKMTELFPEAQILSRKYSVLRLNTLMKLQIKTVR